MKGFIVTQETPESLVEKAKGGNRAAFDDLFGLYMSRLRSWIEPRVSRRLQGSLEAEDLLQDTQLRAFQLIQRFTWKGDDSFYRWLCIIAQHLIWNASQKRSLEDTQLVLEPPAREVSPSKLMRRKERFDRLEESLLNLKPDEREAVRLSRIEGLPVKQIAETLRRPEPTVRSLIARGLKKLRESFGDTESLHLPPDHYLNGEDPS